MYIIYSKSPFHENPRYFQPDVCGICDTKRVTFTKCALCDLKTLGEYAEEPIYIMGYDNEEEAQIARIKHYSDGESFIIDTSHECKRDAIDAFMIQPETSLLVINMRDSTAEFIYHDTTLLTLYLGYLDSQVVFMAI